MFLMPSNGARDAPQIAAPGAPLTGDYERAMAAFRAADYATAAVLFASAESASPGATNALLWQAKALVHLGAFLKAEGVLRGYLAFHPSSDDALYLLGFTLHRLDKPRESLTMYTTAAAIKPPTGDDLKIVGLDYVLLNDYSDAVKWLQKAVDLDSKNGDAWYYLGRAYYSEGRVPDARRAFLTVLSLNAQDARAENNLGLVFESEGKTNDALEAYRKAIAWQQASARLSEQPFVNLGNLLIEQQRAAEAVSPLEKAVTLAPKSGFCHLKLGTAYLRLGRWRDAHRELETAVQLEPDNPSPHYQLGRLYQETHEIDRAKAEFARTQELQSHAAGKVAPPPKQ